MIRRSTGIVVAAFIVLLGLALYLQRNPPDETSQAEPTEAVSYLLDVSAESLSRLRINDAAGKTVEVSRDSSGAWTLVEPADQPADVARIESAVAQIGFLQVTSTLEDPPALSVVGLQPPKYRLSAVGEDGREQIALIGDQTPTQTGYYAQREGGPLVVVSQFSLDSLLELFNNPPVMATPVLPTPAGTAAGIAEGSATPDATGGP